jgi:F-type H+-transporting ATPase subunit b
MHFDWWSFGLQTVNFAVLVWLLHRFLYRPVLRLVDARAAEIDSHYAQAKAAEEEAAAQREAVAAERAGIAAEREAALQAAAAAAETAAQARHAQAEREAAALIEAARTALAAERGEALAAARRAAIDLGSDIARRLLSEVPPALRAEAWLEHIENYLRALPPPQRAALRRQLDNGAALDVVTAAPLPADTAKTWRGRLDAALEGPIEIAFAVDPQLVAGAELHFPTAVLRFSWQSAVAALRTEIEADGAPG